MKFARKTDLIIIAALILIGIIVWAGFSGVFGRSGAAAEIYYKSELVKTVDLSAGKDERFSLEQLPNVVFHQYSDGSIAFEESDCPDKVCVKSGHLHLVGQTAACLPNQIYIKIIGTGAAQPAAPDIIIG
jgi:hypothetical protein